MIILRVILFWSIIMENKTWLSYFYLFYGVFFFFEVVIFVCWNEKIKQFFSFLWQVSNLLVEFFLNFRKSIKHIHTTHNMRFQLLLILSVVLGKYETLFLSRPDLSFWVGLIEKNYLQSAKPLKEINEKTQLDHL